MSLLQTICLVVFLSIIGIVIKHLDVKVLLNNRRIQHVVFGFTAGLFFLWLFRTGIEEGLTVHFLWLTALMLTLGLRWALISGSVALAGITLLGLEDWALFGVNGLLGVVAPICFSYLVFMLVFHKLPRHLFVYIFACAFFPGAAAIALKMALFAAYYVLTGYHSWRVVFDNYLILTPLMLFPEAMLNGMTVTLLSIYKPQWMYTFHDKFYLDK